MSKGVERRPVVTRADLVTGLRRVGLSEGDVVFVHSSLSAFGWVEGGPDAAIDALLEAVGPTGTVAMPAFTWSRYHDINEPIVFDVQHEPVKDEVGLIPEVFRQRPGVLRSGHICHSVAAIGPHAQELMGDGVKGFGKGSVFDHLEQLDAWYLFLGAPMASCTALHYVEDLMQVPYRSYRDYRGSVILWPDGTREPSRAVEFLRQPGVQVDLGKMEAIFAEHGVLRTTRVGQGRIINLRIRDLIRIAVACLEQDIYFLVVKAPAGTDHRRKAR